ncbi:MAG TPA: protease pro-enzyme activation domain-containing protein, partial [Acidobacteriaceae bacterium]|nr:protease pro-enzyme activation domain-containing protein [Acidobacteriaceae bacterium]
MRINSLPIGALMLGALTVTAFSQTNPALNRLHVDTLGAAAPNAITHFNVYLPLTHQEALDRLLQDQTDASSPTYHHWLTPAQFKAQFGPSSTDMAKASAALRAAGFSVVAERTQSLEVEGPVSAVEKMFAAHLNLVRTERGATKLAAAEEHLTMPATLASLGAVVPEFTTHLAAHVHSARGPRLSDAHPGVRLGSTDSFYYSDDMREAYQMPSFIANVTPPHSKTPVQLDGAGATIGIVISSVISPTDLNLSFNSTVSTSATDVDVQAYSANTSVPVPTVVVVPVNGGS